MVEFALLPNTERDLEGITDTPETGTKYGYPEFAGWSGERYLKKLLRQILPMALYRTWEIFAEHQAPDNDCYLGVWRLAECAGRSIRTMEKNLASLCARGLLVQRAERKIVRCQADGTLQCRVVLVKDFRGLYALAHDYHVWTQSETYVPPERAVLSLLETEPHLIPTLRRFENYRRLLSTRAPGPAARLREEDRWFAPDQPALSRSSREREEDSQARREKSDRFPSLLSAPAVSEDWSASSPQRKERTAMRRTRERDSLDSVRASCSLKPEAPALECASPRPVQPRDGMEHPPFQREAAFTPAEMHPLDEPSAFQEGSTHTRPACDPGVPLLQTGSDGVPVSAFQLTDEFLIAVADSLGDQSPKGTRTRIRACFQEAGVTDPAEVALCLLRAYVVARDASRIRAEHCHPETGQINRTPLFCAMVPRLIDACRRGPWWESDWQAIQDAIAADPSLASWWQQYQGLLPVGEALCLDSSQEPGRGLLPEADPERAIPPAILADDDVPVGASQELLTPPSSLRRTRLSQTDQAREERAALARRVLRHLWKRAVPIQDGIILWEHVACGNPLYHRVRGRDVCALCCPDPEWPEEVLALLRSIVEPEQMLGEDTCAAASSGQAEVAGADAWQVPQPAGWALQDEAYREACHLLNSLAELGYEVEVWLEPTDAGYQVVLRDDQSEWICTCPEQIDALIAQVAQYRSDLPEQTEAVFCSPR